MVDQEDFKRLEDKVDLMTSALGKLILFEDRQARMGERLGEVDKDIVANYTELLGKISVIDRQVSKWINMVMGGWAVISFIITIATLVAEFLSRH